MEKVFGSLKSKPEVMTNEYQFDHGKLPRGTGHWAFATSRCGNLDDMFWFNGTYAEAKKAAREHFRGSVAIWVQS